MISLFLINVFLGFYVYVYKLVLMDLMSNVD